ncbi:hypothetical protein LJC00_01040 [Dysgonomonas sp. OttesenSCG-928-M03]|nr:hypothetical protein [Dysgonomonas sp. OttesenSCG-928-M03]
MLDYFLQRSIKSGIKKYNRKHSFLNYNNIESILILFDIEGWHDLQPIIEDLHQNGKKVSAWTIRAKNTPASKFPPYVRVIQPEELTWMGLFKDNVINEYENLHYDTLLDLSSEQNEHLLLLLTLNKSQFCIGLIEREYKLYDFILLKKDSQSLDEAYEELKKYLEHIE